MKAILRAVTNNQFDLKRAPRIKENLKTDCLLDDCMEKKYSAHSQDQRQIPYMCLISKKMLSKVEIINFIV